MTKPLPKKIEISPDAGEDSDEAGFINKSQSNLLEQIK